MPNWTDNTMEVIGPKDALDRFHASITVELDNGDTALSIVNLVPMPKILEGTTSPTPDSPDPHPNWAVMLANGEMTQEWYDSLVAENLERYNEGQRVKAQTGYYSWYDWQAANWGIKWGDIDTHLTDESNDSHSYAFQTPWSPFGERFMENISRMFPTLTFVISYSEESMAFVGAAAFRNGELVSDIVGEIPEIGDPDDQDSWYNATQDYMDERCRCHDKAVSEALTTV